LSVNACCHQLARGEWVLSSLSFFFLLNGLFFSSLLSLLYSFSSTSLLL